jgi:hypothetical protein
MYARRRTTRVWQLTGHSVLSSDDLPLTLDAYMHIDLIHTHVVHVYQNTWWTSTAQTHCISTGTVASVLCARRTIYLSIYLRARVDIRPMIENNRDGVVPLCVRAKSGRSNGSFASGRPLCLFTLNHPRTHGLPEKKQRLQSVHVACLLLVVKYHNLQQHLVQCYAALTNKTPTLRTTACTAALNKYQKQRSWDHAFSWAAAALMDQDHSLSVQCA